MSKPRDEKQDDRQWDQWRRHVGSPRRERDRWVPSDEIEVRCNSLWFWSPCSSDSSTEEARASWPAQRRQILLESHAEVMESLSRYGKLP